MTDVELKTPEDALTLALTLAITAETEKQSKECAILAREIGRSMTEKQIELCKAAAICAVEFERTYK